MKKIYKYSEKKFTKFTPHKQLSIIYEMLEALEKSFDDELFAAELKISINECMKYAQAILNQSNFDGLQFTSRKNVVFVRDMIGRQLGMNLRDSDIVVRRYDKKPDSDKKFPLVLVLDSLRSAFNVGSILRIAECLGVAKVILCGTTPNEKNKKVSEISMGTAEYVNIIEQEDIHQVIDELKAQNYEICALELSSKSIQLRDYIPNKEQVALILGNESLGVSEEVLAKCDIALEIAMKGWKNSLNVANATAIASYEITAKMEINNDN